MIRKKLLICLLWSCGIFLFASSCANAENTSPMLSAKPKSFQSTTFTTTRSKSSIVSLIGYDIIDSQKNYSIFAKEEHFAEAYVIYSNAGDEFFRAEAPQAELKMQFVEQNVLEMSYGTGTMSIDYRYFDVYNRKVSCTYNNILTTGYGLVVYMESGDWSNPCFVIENMFDTSKYQKRLYRNFCYDNDMLPQVSFLDENRMKICYLSQNTNAYLQETIVLSSIS